MKEHGDLRKTRSRQYLVAALIRLMKQRPLTKYRSESGRGSPGGQKYFLFSI